MLVNCLQIYVTTQDGRTFVGLVEIVDSELDIAILKIQSETPFPYAKLGTSAELRPGDWVIAIGSPCFLNNTITLGIVSCVNRKGNDTGISTEYIQADCSVNPGNSGGPLVNIDGEVVGVSVWKFATSKYSNEVLATQGLGFYVPIDSVSKIMVENSTRKGY
ncbi:unnamed protein product [Cuscuta epithymum]|uniref:Trypsin-like serine protease n=1 Tax=Cuscuta epithymum TaxID=186058 RepID=A0AAV0CEZ1_9ASTE|nr:unnamed protein product [Cuscuta epithymum]